jgi:hypothetical protein
MGHHGEVVPAQPFPQIHQLSQQLKSQGSQWSVHPRPRPDGRAVQQAGRCVRRGADLFAKLAALTVHHRLAWDVGTDSGQAAIWRKQSNSFHALGKAASSLNRCAVQLATDSVHTPFR